MSKYFALFTGGKDSTLALIKALNAGYDVDALLTLYPEDPFSYMFHSTNVGWTYLHAVSMGKAYYAFKTSGAKDEELEDLRRAFEAMRSLGYGGVVTGAILSRYQMDRIAATAEGVGLKVLSPLWGLDQRELMYEYLRNNVVFMITQVAAKGLTREHLGWVIKGAEDVERLIKLSEKYGFNPSGEGGDYETFVLKAPIMKYPIKILDYDVEWAGDSGRLLIKSAVLEVT